MPLRYRIDPAARLVRIEYLAQPDFAQWAAMMARIFADPAYRPGFGFLSDRRPVAEPPTSAYIRQVSAFIVAHQDRLRGGRLAMLVGGPATFGMARMSGERIAGTGLEQAVFTSEAEALLWLAESGADDGAHRPDEGS